MTSKLALFIPSAILGVRQLFYPQSKIMAALVLLSMTYAIVKYVPTLNIISTWKRRLTRLSVFTSVLSVISLAGLFKLTGIESCYLYMFLITLIGYQQKYDDPKFYCALRFILTPFVLLGTLDFGGMEERMMGTCLTLVNVWSAFDLKSRVFTLFNIFGFIGFHTYLVLRYLDFQVFNSWQYYFCGGLILVLFASLLDKKSQIIKAKYHQFISEFN